jgi:hypothetical protein
MLLLQSCVIELKGTSNTVAQYKLVLYIASIKNKVYHKMSETAVLVKPKNVIANGSHSSAMNGDTSSTHVNGLSSPTSNSSSTSVKAKMMTNNLHSANSLDFEEEEDHGAHNNGVISVGNGSMALSNRTRANGLPAGICFSYLMNFQYYEYSRVHLPKY